MMLPQTPSDIPALDGLQNTLRGILNTYVSGSYLRRIAKYGYPILWDLSPYRVSQAVNELVRAAIPLRHDPYVAQWLNRLKDRIPDITTTPETVLTEGLSDGYRYLKQRFVARVDTTQRLLPEAPLFHKQTYLGLDRDYFRPVVALERYIHQTLAPYLTDVWIHGSVADLRLAKGFSDLDVLCVLDEEVVTTPQRLMSFARKCYRSQIYLYAFDHLQHHGLQLITAVDWFAYPESWLPLKALQEGVTLLRQTKDIRTRDSQRDARIGFEQAVESLVIGSRRGWIPTNAYEFKYFLSSLMLLPALFWQAQNRYCTKRDSFAELKTLNLSPDDTAFKTASNIRSLWPDIRVPYSLRFMAPTVLNRLFAGRNESMLDHFSNTLTKEAASSAVRLFNLVENKQDWQASAPGIPLAVTNDPIPYSQVDYDLARKDYVRQASRESGVVAILEFGSVTDPGLSDLDFVTFVNDGASVTAAALSIHGLSLTHVDLIMHEPLVLPLSLVPRLNEWLPFAQNVILYRSPSFLELPPTVLRSDDPHVQIARLLEKLYQFRRWFLTARHSNLIEARMSLAILKSLQYSIHSAQRVTGTRFAAATSFVEDLKTLRVVWLQTDQFLWRHEQLRSLYQRGEELLQECVVTISDWLQSREWLKTSAEGTKDPLARLTGLYARESLLSEVLEVTPDHGPDTPFEIYLAQRAALLAQQQRFLQQNNLSFGSLF